MVSVSCRRGEEEGEGSAFMTGASGDDGSPSRSLCI
jgi:hypothetical protein